LVTAVFAGACRSEGNASSSSGASGALPDSGAFNRAALLGAFADTIVSSYREFATSSEALKGAVDAWAANGDAARPAAQEAFRTTFRVWHVADAMRVGPLAMNSSPGGRELRDPIYAWPLQSRCAVEQALVDKVYEDPNFAVVAFANVRGLATLEYLLFYSGTDNACPAENPINRSGRWAAITADDLAQRRRAYAKVVVADVAKRAGELVTAWSDPGGNFASELRQAGQGSKVFGNERIAMNAVSDSVLTLSLELKNMKVGEPVGTVKCTKATCPEALESPFARVSIENVRANLEGMRRILLGKTTNADLGFDDLLTAIGAGEFAASLTQTVETALARAKEVSSLEDAVAGDLTAAKALYEALKALEVALKTQFTALLNLEIPKVVEGDND
jgi:predicted lipoprotein